MKIGEICLEGHKATLLSEDGPRGGQVSAGVKTLAFTMIVAPTGPQKRRTLTGGTYRLTLHFVPRENSSIGSPTSVGIAMAIAPTLDAVSVLPLRGDKGEFTIRLQGSGFDTKSATENEILMGRPPQPLYPQRVCWGPTCTPIEGVRGEIVSDREIRLRGVDPADESANVFAACVGGQCSDPVRDVDATSGYYRKTLLPSIALTAFTVFLILQVGRLLRRPAIDGEKYILRALFIDKETNSYSLSKLQFYLWTVAALFGYTYLMLARTFVQHQTDLPPIPSGLPGLLAIATATAVGAQVVTNVNGPKGAGPTKPGIADFVTTGDMVAADRVQFLVWTIVGVLGFMILTARLDPRVAATLPTVPESLLVISGISAFGYLGGKLARAPGPVVAEVTARTGSDPDVLPTTAGVPMPATPPSAASTAAATGQLAVARGELAAAKKRLETIATAPGRSGTLDDVIAVARLACDRAEEAMVGAEGSLGSGGPSPEVRTRIAAASAAAHAASQQATNAASAFPPAASPAEREGATSAAATAQLAAAVAQNALAAVPSSPVTLPDGSAGDFGVLEIRGRTISRAGLFRLSRGEAPADNVNDDLELTFDKLQPSPLDQKAIPGPRIVERDESSDDTMARRMRLVIKDPVARAICADAGKYHTLTIVNPDAQRAVFRFRVPESQKAG
jgi:hypothetical protein